MIHSTPPEGYEPLAEVPPILDAIRACLDDATAVGDPLLAAGYYEHGVTLAKALGMALQQASGIAQRQWEAEARARGEEECCLCHLFKPKDEMVRENTGGGKEERRNHYWVCLECKEKP